LSGEAPSDVGTGVRFVARVNPVVYYFVVVSACLLDVRLIAVSVSSPVFRFVFGSIGPYDRRLAALTPFWFLLLPVAALGTWLLAGLFRHTRLLRQEVPAEMRARLRRLTDFEFMLLLIQGCSLGCVYVGYGGLPAVAVVIGILSAGAKVFRFAPRLRQVKPWGT
jgi:hypothetical protein